MTTKSPTRTIQVNSETLSKVMNSKTCREYFLHLNAVEKYQLSLKKINDYFEWKEKCIKNT